MSENPYLTPPNLNDVREAAWDEGYAACAAERDEKLAALMQAAKAITVGVEWAGPGFGPMIPIVINRLADLDVALSALEDSP